MSKTALLGAYRIEHLFDVHNQTLHQSKCLFRLLTGYDCPGCGSQRAFHALLHGRLAEAWGYNPYLFFAVPAGAVLIAAEAVRRSQPRLHRTLVNPLSATIILAATIAWWVFRNL